MIVYHSIWRLFREADRNSNNFGSFLIENNISALNEENVSFLVFLYSFWDCRSTELLRLFSGNLTARCFLFVVLFFTLILKVLHFTSLYSEKKNEFSFVSFFSVSLRVYFCRICFDYYQKLKFIRLLISLEFVSDPLLVSLSYLLPSSILNKTIGSRCYLFLVHLVNPIWESKL